MRKSRERLGWIAAGWVVALGAVAVPTAQAELQQVFLRGLNLFDYSVGLERNLLGRGWEFNAAAPYAGQTYRLGLADLTLGANSPATVRLNAGYTTRGLPAAHFSMSTGNPLSYTLDLNYGFQDLVATGNVLINIDTKINALGFYDQSFQISNRGTYTTDGFGPTDSGTLDFDAGPIIVSGNIFADLAAAITQPFFDASGTENPFAKFSQQATKVARATETVNALNAKMAAGETLSNAEVGALVNNSIIAAVLGTQPDANLFDSLMAPAGLFDASGPVQAGPLVLAVPEPASLGLMAVGMLLVCRRRR